MAHINFMTCSAQELHDLARATYAMHNDQIGVVKLGSNFTIFDLQNEGAEVNLSYEHTNRERLLMHVRGFLANKIFSCPQ